MAAPSILSFRTLSMAICAMLPILFAAGCKQDDDGGAHRGLVRLSDDEVKNLDPQKISDLTSLRVAEDQFEGLTRHRGDGRAELGMASAMRCAPDKLRCRFTLRPGLRFSDGTPITAATFAGGFDRLRDPKTMAPNAKLFDGIESIAAEGRKTVVVTMRRPLPWLAELLTQPAVAALPLHRIAAAGERWTSERPLVTSGAYRLTDWRLGDRLTLARNPAWHDPPAPTPIIVWQPAEDKLAALRRFRRAGGGYGQRHSGQPPGMDPHPSARSGTHCPLCRHLLSRVQHPTAAIRRCACPPRPVHGNRPPMDRDQADGHRRDGRSRPCPPILGGRDPDVFAASDRRREIGRLLAQAGYGPQHPLVFDVRFNSGGDHRRIAVALAAMWRPYGVEARLLNSEAALHFAALRLGDFQLARSGWIADVPRPENFLAVHLSNAGPVNYSGFADSEYDRLVERALQTPAPATRTGLLEAAEETVVAGGADPSDLSLCQPLTGGAGGARMAG